MQYIKCLETLSVIERKRLMIITCSYLISALFFHSNHLIIICQYLCVQSYNVMSLTFSIQTHLCKLKQPLFNLCVEVTSHACCVCLDFSKGASAGSDGSGGECSALKLCFSPPPSFP